MGNPFDLTAAATAGEFDSALTRVLGDESVDGALVIGVRPIAASFEEIGRALTAAAATRPDKPVIACSLGRSLEPGSAVVTGTEHALHPIPMFQFPEQAVRAFGRVAAYGAWRRADEGRVFAHAAVDGAAAGGIVRRALGADPVGRWLDAAETDAFLGAAGIHRAATGPDATGAVEIVVGVVDDGSFGPLLMFGLGGTAAELLDDRSYGFLPLSDSEAAALLRSVRLSPLLFGLGGSQPVDEAALIDLLLRVSSLAEAVPELAELELKPLMATPRGVTVVGARVRVVPPPAGPGPLMRTLR
jgi:acyl-CoA synthetase (NDP forming)